MANPAEDRVQRIALHAFEEVPAQQALVLHVADFRFHRGPPTQMAFEGVAELAGAADEHTAAFLGHAVALVASVYEGEVGNLARDSLDLVELAFQSVAVVGVAGTGLDADDEALLVGHRQAHLHPELVGLVRLSFGNALNLRGMEAVDLAFGESFLGEDQLGQEHSALVGLKRRVVHLALDISHHPPRHGLQGSEDLAGPLELLGLGVAAVFLEGTGHQLAVALAQDDALLLGDSQHGRVDLSVEPGVRRMLHRLRLYRGVDDDPVQALFREEARHLGGSEGGL